MQTFRESDTGLVSRIAALQDKTSFKELHWEGSFEDYLRIVRENPRVTRTAFQRIYDMILSHGKTEYIDNKKKLIRYHFFHDEKFGGRDAVYGLDVPLMKLVNVFKSAAQGYGTEKRVILLHGPVGSAKSTIVRLLKKGTEEYSRTPDGALYTFSWKLDKKNGDGTTVQQDYQTPMNEDPLLLIPEEWREKVFADLCPPDSGFKIPVGGDLCPASRLIFRELMAEYKGEFAKVIQHVRVKRLLLSEKDRIGIGTFQPKDEKNQDSTELTGDINYRKIAEYGTDSDPRAFNFDGELNIANRGLVEFIEVLKLDVAFLYDLLGASQEHKIKPKKFAQTDIDEVILGHSVAGDTPILYRLDGTPGWTTLEGLHERFAGDPAGLEVLAHDFDDDRPAWTPVRGLFRHRFTGKLLTTSQKWGAVETTPNHSIYDRHGQAFYPEERREVLALRRLPDLYAPERGIEVIDVVEGVEGFVRDTAAVTATGGMMTHPCRPGWAGLDLPRHATAVQAV
ncbi:MAG: hypothetical protein ACJ781_02765, partial [Myxococcales bacterium]